MCQSCAFCCCSLMQIHWQHPLKVIVSIHSLWIFSITKWLNLFCDIFALSHVFIRRAVENDLLPVALIAGLTNKSLQIVITSLIIGLELWSTLFTAPKTSAKHCTFLPSSELWKFLVVEQELHQKACSKEMSSDFTDFSRRASNFTKALKLDRSKRLLMVDTNQSKGFIKNFSVHTFRCFTFSLLVSCWRLYLSWYSGFLNID